MEGPIASFASGYSRFTACAITWLAEWRSAASPFSSFAVKIFKVQSEARTVRRSIVSPLTSPTQAIRPKPSLTSFATCKMDMDCEYSFTLPSFNVIFIFFFLPFLLSSHRSPYLARIKKRPLPSDSHTGQGTISSCQIAVPPPLAVCNDIHPP